MSATNTPGGWPSESTVKGYINAIDYVIRAYRCDLNPLIVEVLLEIRALLSQPPTVSWEFVEKWGDFLFRLQLWPPGSLKGRIIEMLREAGVAVKEEKK